MNEHAPESDVQDPVRRDVNGARRAGRSRFQGFLGTYLKSAHRRGTLLVKSWASVWDVSRQQVERWGSELHSGSPLAAGDLEALPDADLLDLLEAWAESVRERLSPVSPANDASVMVIVASQFVGKLANRVHDAMCAKSRGGERITPDEWREIADEWAAIERTAREQRLAATAAASRRAR